MELRENQKKDREEVKPQGRRKLEIGKILGLYSYLMPYRGVFLPSMLALFVTAALSLAFPYFLGSLIGGTTEGSMGVAGVQEKMNGVIGALLGVLLLQAFISYWRVRGFIKAGELALADLRRDLFAQMLRLPMGWFSERRPGEVSGRFTGDLAILRDTLLTTVPQFVRQVVMLVGGLVFVFLSSVKLAAFMLGVIPVVVLAVAVFGRKIRSFSRAAQDRLAESNVVVEEATQGVADVKAFSNEGYEEERYEGALGRFLEATFQGANARAAFVSFIILVLFGTIALVVWFGAGMLVKGEITREAFSHFILFSIFIGASLGAFPEIVSQLQKTAGATERVREMLGEKRESLLETDEGGNLSGELSLREVSFFYPSRPEKEILRGFNMEVKAGEKVALVGPSGGGKSTLFSLLLGFYKPSSGAVLYDGREVPLGKVREAMAVVPQEVLLFGGSILENIRYGQVGASDEEVREAARLAYAAEFIEGFPEGYETFVGPRGMKLSGGQRQRIAIARAILADPKILLLDEATSALDSESETKVQAALARLMMGRTCLVIAHRLGTVREADRILVMNKGEIAEIGRHEELMEKGGLYAVLAETQLMNG